MYPIDLRTIFLNFILTDFISLLFVVVLWFQNRKRYEGLLWIALDFVFHFLGILLIFLRGIVPDFISIVLSNSLGILGGFCGIIGFSKFVGSRYFSYYSFFYIPLFFFVQYYFTYLNPDLALRNLNIAFGYTLISGWSALVLMYKTPLKLNSYKLTGVVLIAFGLVNFLRIIFFFTSEVYTGQSYFHAGSSEVFIAIAYQVVLLLLGFAIVLMVNRRLVHDITDEEQKLSVAYRAVPYAILISRKHDGVILDVNHGFEHTFGFTHADAVGRTSNELRMWVSGGEREKLQNALSEGVVQHNMYFNFRAKSGVEWIGQVSAALVRIDNEDCMLLVIDNVTDRKKNEAEVQRSRDILKKIVVDLHTEHEIERINLATRIDNQLNQSLAALRMNIGTIKRKMKSEGSMSDELLGIVDDTYTQTGATIERSLALMNNMRNEVLYLLGLAEAITYSMEEIEGGGEIHCTMECDPPRIEMDPQKSSVLYNVFQELANRILYVQKATYFSVELRKTKDIVVFSLTENGNSFDDYFELPERTDTMLHLLRERLALYNAVLYATRNGSDTDITIEMRDSEQRVG